MKKIIGLILMSSISFSSLCNAEEIKDKTSDLAYHMELIKKNIISEANNGNSQAQVLLGLSYLNGKITGEEDSDDAFKWFKKSADNGNGDAMFQIGLMFLNGNGVPKDIDLGHEWIEKAANNKSHLAQYFLAMLLRKKSHDYIEESAKGGNVLAIERNSLDFMYGDGVDVDLDKSYYWGYIALKMGINKLEPSFSDAITQLSHKVNNKNDIEKSAESFYEEIQGSKK